MNLRSLLSASIMLICLAACGEKDTPADINGDLIVKSEIDIAASAPQQLNIKAPVKPTISNDADWLHVGEINSKTAGIYSANLTADVNPKGTSRSTELTITAGNASAKVKVTQRAGEAVEITEVQPSATLDAKGGDFTLKFVATSKPEISVPEWITFDKNFDYTAGSLVFSYGAATTGSREGEIILSLSSTIKSSVKVSQQKVEMPSDMGSTAKQLAAKMYAGINIGNTLECPGKEGAWSMPVNDTYVASLAKMGFNAVRIPCAWDSHLSDEATNTIDPAWLDRVDEVVGYVIGNGMYALLNIHWDGGWLENTCKDGYDEAVNKKQHDYWTQIANKLNHYDEHLLLAAMNEPNAADKGAKKEEGIKAIMKYQQTMLDAVRATGGNNASRVLVMQAPNTSNEMAVEGLYELPKDVIADRLMVETHFYGPYQFNMMENDESWGKTFWYWGKGNHVDGSDHNSTWGEEDWVKEQFDMMKKHFIDKGIPGITGEYCVCCNRENTPGIDKEKWRASTRLWAKVVTRESKNAGMVPFFWEVGGDIDRANGSVKNPLQLDGVFEGAAEGKYPF